MNHALSTKMEENCVEDLLNRTKFIDQVIQIIKNFSEKKKSICYAIDGKWGVGKTFVLEKIEKQIKTETDVTDKFYVFNYNCWKNDFYEEPLVAFVASMLDTIEENENLIPHELKLKTKNLLKCIGTSFLKKANETIKDKIGIDPKEIIDAINDSKNLTDHQIETLHQYDTNFLFKSTLKNLQETLQTLSEERTLVIFVDELDRCLPEYAIKVLERLHHVLDGLENVQIILSIDKSQLEHIVQNSFGEGTNVEKYLSKFISFYLSLDEGSFFDCELFDNRFSSYTQLFEKSYDENFDYLTVNDFKTKIFEGIEIRERIAIIDRCELIHSMLNNEDTKLDYSFMCVELFLSVLNYLKWPKKSNIFDHNIMFGGSSVLPLCFEAISQMYKHENEQRYRLFGTEHNCNYIRCNCFMGLIVLVYRTFLGITKDSLSFNDYNAEKYRQYSKEFIDYLKIIN